MISSFAPPRWSTRRRSCRARSPSSSTTPTSAWTQQKWLACPNTTAQLSPICPTLTCPRRSSPVPTPITPAVCTLRTCARPSTLSLIPRCVEFCGSVSYWIVFPKYLKTRHIRGSVSGFVLFPMLNSVSLNWENWIGAVSIAAPCWCEGSTRPLKEQNFQDPRLSSYVVKRVKRQFTQNWLQARNALSKRAIQKTKECIAMAMACLSKTGFFQGVCVISGICQVINQRHDRQLCFLVRAKICLFTHWEHRQIITSTSEKVLDRFSNQTWIKLLFSSFF